MVASLPSWRGTKSSSSFSVTTAFALLSSSMSSTLPILAPPTCTGLPGTSAPAFWKTAFTL